MERNKIIEKNLKSGIIKLKENSKSIYYDISIFKNKKWFEIEDLTKNKLINSLVSCYIINSKKGIGKTYQMRLMMKQVQDKGNFFVFVRRTAEDIKKQKIEWENAKGWPYFIKGSSIFNKDNNDFVGMITTISTLYNMTGLEMENYTHIFFDEFKDKRGITRYVSGEFKKFVKFLLDVQRVKEDIKIFMFANDESKYDPYTTGLHIDSTVDYFIDLYAGFFYVNLKEFYKGAINENSVGYRLASYDEELKDELDTNATVYSDEHNMIDISKSNIDDVNYYFSLNKTLYVFGFNLSDNIAIIKSIKSIPKHQSNKTIYAMTTLDYTAQPNIYKPFSVLSLVKVWSNLLNLKKMWFVSYQDKREIETHIKRVLGALVS